MNWVKKYWGLVILFFIALPFVLNFAVTRVIPFELEIAGEPKDWIVFWGAYMGVIATIIIIFITLKNQEEIKKAQLDNILFLYKSDFANTLKSDVLKINSVYSLIEIPILSVEKVNFPNDAYALRRLCQATNQSFYSIYLLETRDKNRFKEYYHKLQSLYECLKCTLQMINEVYKSKLHTDATIDEIKKCLDKIINDKDIAVSKCATKVKEKFCNQEDFDDPDVGTVKIGSSSLINAENEIISFLWDEYYNKYNEIFAEGVKLIRIEKESLQSIFKDNEANKFVNKEDLPF